MKSNINDLKIHRELPNTYGDVVNRYFEMTYRHYNDGWRDVVKPNLEVNEKMINLHYDKDNDVITWDVIEMTEEEIKQNEIL